MINFGDLFLFPAKHKSFLCWLIGGWLLRHRCQTHNVHAAFPVFAFRPSSKSKSEQTSANESISNSRFSINQMAMCDVRCAFNVYQLRLCAFILGRCICHFASKRKFHSDGWAAELNGHERTHSHTHSDSRSSLIICYF